MLKGRQMASGPLCGGCRMEKRPWCGICRKKTYGGGLCYYWRRRIGLTARRV